MPAGRGEAIPQGFTEVKPVVRPDAVKTAPTPPPSGEVTKAAAEVATAPLTPDAPPASDAGSVATPAADATTPAPERSKLEVATEAAEKARRGAKNFRALREERERLQQQASFANTRATQLEGALRETQQFQAQLRADPLAAVKALGITAEQLAKQVAVDGTPEALISRLEAKLADQDARIRQMIEREQATTQQIQRAKLENDFKAQAVNPKKYPNLQGVNPAFILSSAKELLVELGRRGHDPAQFSNHDVLDYLNTLNAKAAPKAAAEATTTESTATSESKKQTKTISNRLQSTASMTPAEFAKLSDRQQRKVMAEQMRAAMAKSA